MRMYAISRLKNQLHQKKLVTICVWCEEKMYKKLVTPGKNINENTESSYVLRPTEDDLLTFTNEHEKEVSSSKYC